MRKSEQQFLYFVHPRGVEKVRLSDRQIKRQTDGHTHTQIVKHTHTQIVRQTNRQTDTD